MYDDTNNLSTGGGPLSIVLSSTFSDLIVHDSLQVFLERYNCIVITYSDTPFTIDSHPELFI